MKARQLNPAETSAFKSEMARLPAEHQADVALKWRERCINALTTYVPNPGREVGELAVSSAYVAGLGWWDGSNEATRNAMIQRWQTQTAVQLGVDTAKYPTPFQDVADASGNVVHKAEKDPRAAMGLNKVVYPTLGLGLLSVGLSMSGRGQMANHFIKAGVLQGTGYIVGSLARDAAYERRTKGLEAGAGQGGQQGNPYRGYPRAA